LAKNVKSKSWYWDLIPWIGNQTAQGIYPNVYVQAFVYENLKSKNPSPWHIALLLHEQEHVKRQKKLGAYKWFLKYLSDPKFRFDEEIAADIPNIRFLKRKKLNPYINKRAKSLSSWLYFWPVSYKTAKRELEKIWRD